MSTLIAIATIVVAYGAGSVIGGYWIGRLRGGIDLRTQGSGNVGATNALRTQGKFFGAAVLMIDAAKGVIAVLLLPDLAAALGYSGSSRPLALGCGLAATLGHVFPVWFGFRGGKGAATFAGVFAALLPVTFGWMLLVFVAAVLLSGIAALGTVAAAVTAVVHVAITQGLGAPAGEGAFVVIAAALVFWTHRSNFERLRERSESRFDTPGLVAALARPLAPEALEGLVAALADGQWHRGEDLAARDGLTRAAVAQRIAKLAGWGLEVETRSGRGYRLRTPLTLLDRDTVAARSGLARDRVEVCGWLDSTNARLAAAAATRDPQACLAEGQSAGRGRRGRAWHSPYGQHIYLSCAWSLSHWPPRITLLPLVVGVTAWRVIRDLGVTSAWLKWPNDLWVDGAKLAGILVEQGGEAGGGCRVVAGIGVNCQSGAWMQAIDRPVTALDACLGEAAPDRSAIAALLIRELMVAVEAFAIDGFAPFADDFARADGLRGQPVRVSDADAVIEGTADGIDDDGALRVRRPDGAMQRVLAGDVSVAPLGDAP